MTTNQIPESAQTKPLLKLACDLLNKPGHWFYVCKGRFSTYALSSYRAPLQFSVADAIALAPFFKLDIEKVMLPMRIGNALIHWDQPNHKPVSGGIRVVGVVGGADFSYEEFLSIFRFENLPNLWFLHYRPHSF